MSPNLENMRLYGQLTKEAFFNLEALTKYLPTTTLSNRITPIKSLFPSLSNRLQNIRSATSSINPKPGLQAMLPINAADA